MGYDFKKLASDYFAEALDDLIALVRIPSVLDEFKPMTEAPFGKYNKMALDKFLEISKKLGFETENARNYAGSAVFGEGKEILGVLGHLDVVPAVGKWTYGPFNPTVNDSKLYGRGTLDDKGGVIAALYAMKILKDQGFKPSKKIKLIAGCDEETGSRCLEHYLEHFPMPDLAFSPDAEFPAIFAEKAIVTFDIEGLLDNDEIISFDAGLRYNIVIDKAELKVKNTNIMHLYSYLMHHPGVNAEIIDDKYVFHGKSAHASTPKLGINAAYYMFDFMNEYYHNSLSEFVVKSLDPEGKKANINFHDDVMGDLTLNLGIATCHDNKVKLGLNLRVPKNEHIAIIKRNFEKLLLNTGYEITKYDFVKVHYVDPNSFLVKSLTEAYQEETLDTENKPFVIGGGTYAKAIPNAIAYGPCFPHRDDICHEPDEHIYLEDFEKWIAIYANAIYKLTK